MSGLAVAVSVGGALGVVTYLTGPGPALLAAAGIVAGMAVLVWAEVGFALLLALVILFNRAELWELSLPFFGGGLKPTDLLLAAMLLRWASRIALRWTNLGRLRGQTNLFVLLFVGWAAVCAFRAISAGVPYKDSLLELRPLLTFLLVLPVITELSIEQITRLLHLLVGCTTIVAIRGIYLYLTGIRQTHGTPFRVMEIEFAYLLIAVLVVTAFFLTGKWSGRIVLPLLVLELAGLAVTFYRSAFLGLAAGFAFLACATGTAGRTRLTRLIAGITVCGGLLLGLGGDQGGPSRVLASLGTRLSSIWNFEGDVSAGHRLSEWPEAIRMVKARPLVGNGLGTRLVFYSPEYSDARKQMGYWSNDFYTHNSYLWVAVKTGGLGLVLFLSMLGAPIAAAVRTLNIGPRDDGRTLLVALLGALTAMLVISIFGPMLNTMNETPFLALAIGGLHVARCAREEAFHANYAI